MPQLTIQSGTDTEILSSQTANNFGTNTLFRAGLNATGVQLRRGLLLPDLSALMALQSVTITNVIIRLFGQSELIATDFNIQCRRALRQWYAGVQNGAPPGAADGSTWAQRNANTGAPLAWGAAGGQSGTDYAASPSSTVSFTGLGTYFDFDITPDAQAIYAGTLTNFGWWFTNASEGTVNSNKGFSSFQAANSAEWPQVIVTYTVPGLLPKLMQYGQFSGGTL